MRTSTNRGLPLSSVVDIARYAFTSSEHRSELPVSTTRAFLDYKNTAGTRSSTRVDLLSEALDRSCPYFQAHPELENLRLPIYGATEDGIKMPALAYELAILLLRRGDRVHTGTEELTLGRFLGAGNASHVFEIAEYPGEVLKIPFLSATLLYIATPQLEREFRPRHPLHYGRTFIRKLVDLAPLYRDHEELAAAEIRAVGTEHAALRVERVSVEHDGSEFLVELDEKKTAGTAFTPAEEGKRELLFWALNKLKVIEYQRFLAAMNIQQVDQIISAVDQAFPEYLLRQNPKLLCLPSTLRTWPTIETIIEEVVGKRLGPIDRQKLQGVIGSNLPNFTFVFYDFARQFGWDGERWRFLDWE